MGAGTMTKVFPITDTSFSSKAYRQAEDTRSKAEDSNALETVKNLYAWASQLYAKRDAGVDVASEAAPLQREILLKITADELREVNALLQGDLVENPDPVSEAIIAQNHLSTLYTHNNLNRNSPAWKEGLATHLDTVARFAETITPDLLPKIEDFKSCIFPQLAGRRINLSFCAITIATDGSVSDISLQTPEERLDWKERVLRAKGLVLPIHATSPATMPKSSGSGMQGMAPILTTISLLTILGVTVVSLLKPNTQSRSVDVDSAGSNLKNPSKPLSVGVTQDTGNHSYIMPSPTIAKTPTSIRKPEATRTPVAFIDPPFEKDLQSMGVSPISTAEYEKVAGFEKPYDASVSLQFFVITKDGTGYFAPTKAQYDELKKAGRIERIYQAKGKTAGNIAPVLERIALKVKSFIAPDHDGRAQFGNSNNILVNVGAGADLQFWVDNSKLTPPANFIEVYYYDGSKNIPKFVGWWTPNMGPFGVAVRNAVAKQGLELSRCGFTSYALKGAPLNITGYPNKPLVTIP